jgi:hypothetical protein
VSVLATIRQRQGRMEEAISQRLDALGLGQFVDQSDRGVSGSARAARPAISRQALSRSLG